MQLIFIVLVATVLLVGLYYATQRTELFGDLGDLPLFRQIRTDYYVDTVHTHDQVKDNTDNINTLDDKIKKINVKDDWTNDGWNKVNTKDEKNKDHDNTSKLVPAGAIKAYVGAQVTNAVTGATLNKSDRDAWTTADWTGEGDQDKLVPAGAMEAYVSAQSFVKEGDIDDFATKQEVTDAISGVTLLGATHWRLRTGPLRTIGSRNQNKFVVRDLRLFDPLGNELEVKLPDSQEYKEKEKSKWNLFYQNSKKNKDKGITTWYWTDLGEGGLHIAASEGKTYGEPHIVYWTFPKATQIARFSLLQWNDLEHYRMDECFLEYSLNEGETWITHLKGTGMSEKETYESTEGIWNPAGAMKAYVAKGADGKVTKQIIDDYFKNTPNTTLDTRYIRSDVKKDDWTNDGWNKVNTKDEKNKDHDNTSKLVPAGAIKAYVGAQVTNAVTGATLNKSDRDAWTTADWTGEGDQDKLVPAGAMEAYVSAQSFVKEGDIDDFATKQEVTDAISGVTLLGATHWRLRTGPLRTIGSRNQNKFVVRDLRLFDPLGNELEVKLPDSQEYKEKEKSKWNLFYQNSKKNKDKGITTWYWTDLGEGGLHIAASEGKTYGEPHIVYWTFPKATQIARFSLLQWNDLEHYRMDECFLEYSLNEGETWITHLKGTGMSGKGKYESTEASTPVPAGAIKAYVGSKVQRLQEEKSYERDQLTYAVTENTSWNFATGADKLVPANALSGLCTRLTTDDDGKRQCAGGVIAEIQAELKKSQMIVLQ